MAVAATTTVARLPARLRKVRGLVGKIVLGQKRCGPGCRGPEARRRGQAEWLFPPLSKTLAFNAPAPGLVSTTTGRYTHSQMVRLTSTRRDSVQYSPNFPTPKRIQQELGLVVRLFGRDEFSYDEDENTADCRLAMYLFAIQKPGKSLG